jgi:Spy/CpxP family protein refolding chaperone
MRQLRSMVFGLGLVLVFGSLLAAADGDNKGRGETKGKGFGRFGESRALVAPEILDKLKLTDEQKDKVAKLDKEFQAKDKEAFGKSRESLRKAIEDKDREGMRKAFEQTRDDREKATKLREEYEGKVTALLSTEQKKTFADAKGDRRSGFGQGGFARRPETPPAGKTPATSTAGATGILAKLDSLNLSEEQKSKVAQLQKELEAKIKDVLTDDQKKKLDDAPKDQPRRRARPNNQ